MTREAKPIELRDLREQLSRPCDDEKFLAALDEARGAHPPRRAPGRSPWGAVYPPDPEPSARPVRPSR